jgi:hypothetical protein
MQIIHNLLTNEELEFIQILLKEDRWGFGYYSTDRTKPIWNFDKEYGRPIAELICKKLENYSLSDWHINGQTMLMDGSPHTDDYCDTAAIFFPNEWKYSYGGRLHIFKNNDLRNNESTIITPQKNMVVLFDPTLIHYAEAPNSPGLLRISVGLKLNTNI